MLDINQALRNLTHQDNDPEGHMFALERWTPQIANQLAASEGLELEDEHWEVIYYLRERYRTHGNEDSARIVLHDLEEKFSPAMGRGHLYRLFPDGPVSQGSRLAGLPTPPHAADLSFGSVM
ncbi:MAG TPA: TusE/DsrC/DsvC family sulfur relay protein [Gallionellaceae bacterium]|nr:TusE/DsrC/DsvC family sulfur relay protein [Gallionellaceae bacterium]